MAPTNDMLRKRKSALVYRIVISLTGWAALLMLWTTAVANRPEGASAFGAMAGTLRYFTVQSNLFVLIWLLLAILYWQRKRARLLLQPVFKGAITVAITVTFVIFATLLQGLVDPEGIHRFINVVTHYLLPIAFIVDWILFERKRSCQWRYALFWLAYPIAYLIFALGYGNFTGDYLYPFLDLPTLGAGGLAIWVVILFMVFVVLGVLAIGLNRVWGMKEAL